ncbi:MAG TPA: type Z 30S ribosomal protein S14 [Phycisphaerae bacterium]|nr:type Z 30S ribosomal protein S14 [Phycisphaerae bacterium]HNU44466.1 type Z 30S ribosomal protein S14 [Phycisphaerae bacterium]
MATKAWMNKARKEPKFMTRRVRRCQICGRVRAVYRKFQVCRICFRRLAHDGMIPGVRKASW